MLQEFDIKDFKENPFKLIGDEWMLICAGDEKAHNMMTASWGGLGVLWGKNVATVYIRPTRFTLDFVEHKQFFTLNFFGKNKSVHKICGSKSGREIDKNSVKGLSPVYVDDAVYFAEAELVLVCKKMYESDLDSKYFLDPKIEEFYPIHDYHKMFIGEIVKAYKLKER